MEKVNDQRSFKEKVSEIFDNAKRKIILTGTAVSKWCGEHKELVVAVSPTIVDSISRIYVEHGRNKRIKMERRHVNNEVYDHRTGKWYVHKTMNKRETLEFSRRKLNGEATCDILNDMGLLRR